MKHALRVVLFGMAAYLHAEEIAPLHPDWSREDRVDRYFQRTFGWQCLSLLALDTGISQISGEPREWDRGPASFAYRYTSGFGRRLVRNSLELGLEVALDEDTRYRPSQETNLGRRLRHAARQAVFTSCGHKDRISYARLGSAIGVELLSARWHPGQRSGWDVAQGVSWAYVGHLQNSFISEFAPDMKALGKRVQRKLLGRSTQRQTP